MTTTVWAAQEKEEAGASEKKNSSVVVSSIWRARILHLQNSNDIRSSRDYDKKALDQLVLS